MSEHEWAEWAEFDEGRILRECGHCGLVQERVTVGGIDYDVDLGMDASFGVEDAETGSFGASAATEDTGALRA